MCKRNKSFYKRFFFSFNGIKRARSNKNHILYKKKPNYKRILRKKIFFLNSNRYNNILY